MQRTGGKRRGVARVFESYRLACILALFLPLFASCGGAEEDDATGVSGAPPPSDWSLLLVTLDTTRGDALTSYGGPSGLTPNLDLLAEEGVAYERAYTVAPLTLPSHASILTGLVPPRHGLRVNGAARLPDEAQTLAEIARDAGFATGAFISSVVLDEAFGLAQGFDSYDAPSHSLIQTDSHFNDRSGVDVVDAAGAWLSARAEDQRVFMWVHLWDPHGPWDPPPELRALAPDDSTGYLGDVALADRAFGRLVEALRRSGRYESTLIVVVADHGEAFWEHGEYSHGALIHESTMRVPLILRYPDGRRAGERTDEIASVVDLVPTLTEALQLQAPADLDGRSLLRGDDAAAGAYLESYYGHVAYGWAPLVGYVDSQGKYLYGGKARLFDPAQDPDEQHDLAGESSEELQGYRANILRLSARPALSRQRAQAGAGLEEGIASLGYAGATPQGELPAPHETLGLPDPHEHVGEHAEILEALGHFNDGDYAEAERRYRAVLARNRENVDALERLGITLIRQRRFEAAVAPLQRAQETGRGSAAGAVNLGTCYRKLERFGPAVAAFERALAIDGSQVRAVRHLVDLHLLTGERDRAAEYAVRYQQLTGEELPIR